jgi:hypothetical protein
MVPRSPTIIMASVRLEEMTKGGDESMVDMITFSNLEFMTRPVIGSGSRSSMSPSSATARR